MLTEAQLDVRQKGVSASDVAALCGVSIYDDAYDIWMRKTGMVAGFAGNRFTYWGQMMEPVLVQAYADSLAEGGAEGLLFDNPGTLAHPDQPRYLATPDRIVERFDGFRWGLECKNTGYSQRPRWKDGVPLNVQLQCQWGMFVTGLANWDVAALIGGNDFRVYPLLRDDRVIETCVEVADRFLLMLDTNDFDADRLSLLAKPIAERVTESDRKKIDKMLKQKAKDRSEPYVPF